MTNRLSARLVPVVFVLLWSSGFVVARLVRPFADPFSFVTLRFIVSAALLALIALMSGAVWPRSRRAWRDGLVTGALMQGAYVGGVFYAVKHGLSPAVAALITGLQPLLTGLLAAPLLGERVGGRRWIGIGLGFAGAILVIGPDLAGGDPASRALPVPIAACVAGMVAMTFGTILQKRTGGKADLRSGAAVQFLGGLVLTVPLALALENGRLGLGHPQVWAALAWAVLVLSVVATLLLLSLIKAGEVAGVASLFYLVPPLTALLAFALFGEALAPIQFVGMALAAGGVAIANTGAAAREGVRAP